MTSGRTSRRVPIAQRRAIGNLLRLADACNQDAQELLKGGSLSNVLMLIRLAVARMVEAALASEPGQTFLRPAADADLQSLSDENPIKARLAALAIDTRREPPLLPDGKLRELPDKAALCDCIDRASAVLADLAEHFDVDLAGGEPAGNVEPVSPLPVASAASPSPPAARRSSRKNDLAEPIAAPEPSNRTTVKQTPHPAPSALLSTAPGSTIPLSRPTSGLSSTVFWSLMDRWGVADLDALTLLGHPGGLTGKGTRPRFKLNMDEIDMLIRLRDIDDALTSAGLDPRKWLQDPVAATPFRGAAPLAFLTQNRLPGARELLHYVFQQGLRLSLGKQ